MSLDVYLSTEVDGNEVELYSANITHNLNIMADKAEIYLPIWRPDEVEIKTAKELIAPLADGVKKLKSDPDYFKTLNASNGWRMYSDFVPWVEDYLEACKKYPSATVSVSR